MRVWGAGVDIASDAVVAVDARGLGEIDVGVGGDLIDHAAEGGFEVKAVGQHHVGLGEGDGVLRAYFVDVGVFTHAHDAQHLGIAAGDLAGNVFEDGGRGDDGDGAVGRVACGLVAVAAAGGGQEQHHTGAQGGGEAGVQTCAAASLIIQSHGV